MTVDNRQRSSSAAARRVGYGIAVALNVVLLYLINGQPGWDAVPFLTDAAADIIPLVNAALVVGLAVNVVQSVRDPLWLAAIGAMLTTTVGAVALVRLWDVFPFDFGDTSFNWALIVRLMLGMGLIGSLIGFVVQVVTLAATSRRPHHA